MEDIKESEKLSIWMNEGKTRVFFQNEGKIDSCGCEACLKAFHEIWVRGIETLLKVNET